MLDLIIIGGGIYGICAANTYLSLHPTANVKVLDSDSNVGGVWSRSRHYPSFWSQTGARLSGFPDKQFKVPEDAETYHDLYDATYITDYLEDYVRDNEHDGRPLKERFVFRCWVRQVWKDENGIWQVRSEIEDRGDVAFRSKKLIVATGAHSVPYMPDLRGSKKFNGPIVHQKDLGKSKLLTTEEEDVEKHSHITVLGGSKSASDIVYAAATHTSHPRKVSWIIRTSGGGPLLLNKAEGFGKYRSVTELGSIRALAAISSANPYQGESWWTWFLHRTPVGQRFLRWVWSQTEKESNTLADFDGREGALPGFESLRPSVSIQWRSGPIGILQRPDYWDAIAKKVMVYRSEVERLEDGKVILTDGREVKSDVLICGTGWKQEHPYFSTKEAARVGLPIGLPEAELGQEEREHWSKLEEEADRKVLQRWPYLASTPTFIGHPPRTTSYKLYSLTLPVEDRSIAFLGLMLVPNSYHTALTQTLYAIAALDGALELPPLEEMEKEIAFMNRWSTRRYPVHGWLGNPLDYEMVSFTDHLLEQLGLSSHRNTRNWWSDLTDPCLASDYAGLVDEYRRKYPYHVE